MLLLSRKIPITISCIVEEKRNMCMRTRRNEIRDKNTFMEHTHQKPDILDKRDSSNLLRVTFFSLCAVCEIRQTRGFGDLFVKRVMIGERVVGKAEDMMID